jgi:hypothetical protein
VNPHRAQIAEALGAISIRSQHRFAWLGVTSPALPDVVASVLSDEVARDFLIRDVKARLYESFYCAGGVVRVGESGDQLGRAPDPVVVAALSTANAGHGSWQRGWRVDAVDADELIVVRDGVRAWARRSECRLRRGPFRIGAEVSIALPAELPALSPGFFTVVGDVDLGAEQDDLIARLYFNVSCAGAPGLVAELTSALNGARVPFRLKVVDHPERFARRDAAVLYLHAADLHRWRHLLRDVINACRAGLQPGTPVFTKPLSTGVGLGEERGGDGESFGMRRCAVLAAGVVRAHEEGIRDLRGRLRLVERHFADAGIDLDAPYLERGSNDGYSL